MAYAETQSMFCDSLISDADWLVRYGKTVEGQPIPPALILARIASSQPMRAFDARSIAVVPYFESALYRMSDDDLTPDRVLRLARETEVRVLAIESPRPLLAIPHLLNQESAASYQGYLLALMAVAQTRAHFLDEFGYLTDNAAIGPALAAHFWQPGNSVDQGSLLRSLTGEGFSARHLAETCNESADEASRRAAASMHAAATRRYPDRVPDSVDADIRIVHGDEVGSHVRSVRRLGARSLRRARGRGHGLSQYDHFSTITLLGRASNSVPMARSRPNGVIKSRPSRSCCHTR
jgi:hypothetical protein